MSNFLLHQRRDGYPVGIFSESGEHFYTHQFKTHEGYGVSVMEARGTDVEWDDWADQLASKTPGPHDMWDVYVAEDDDLEAILEQAQRDTDYN